MELSHQTQASVTQLNTKNPIPVFGIVQNTAPNEKKSQSAARVKPKMSEDEKLELIALCAYFRAEARGFEPGYEMEDWLMAEAEIG